MSQPCAGPGGEANPVMGVFCTDGDTLGMCGASWGCGPCSREGGEVGGFPG